MKLARNFREWWVDYTQGAQQYKYYMKCSSVTAYVLTLLNWWIPFSVTIERTTCKIFGHKIKYLTHDQGDAESGMHLPPTECTRCGEIKL